jgi:hypothetical protein
MVLSLAAEKGLQFGPYSCAVWLASALVLSAMAAVPAALAFAAMRFQMAKLRTVFLTWAAGTAILGFVLVFCAR